jgi:hypothetical protein
VNNSAIHPQEGRLTTRPVCNQGSDPSAWGRAKGALTRGYADSSTIHTPYYDYLIGLQQRAVRRKGIICAYPS